MKSRQYILALLILPIILSGCKSTFLTKVSPEDKKYHFLESHEVLGEHYDNLYKATKEKVMLKAYIGHPRGYSVCFSGNSAAAEVANKKKSPLEFKKGVYPFKLYRSMTTKTGKPVIACGKLARAKNIKSYSGAMIVYNLDSAVSLATFGLKKDTALFDAGLLSKVDKGNLAKHEIVYDDKSRIYYWLGNRSNLFAGGNPKVELDFSGVRGISGLTINGKKQKKQIVELSSHKVTIDKHKQVIKTPIEYKFTMKMSNGREYQGYIKNLADNEMNAFMRIPISINSKLFNAANEGTIAKFDVIDETSGNAESLAQLMFGLKS